MNDLIRRLAADEMADAAGILRFMATELPPRDTAAAISACIGQGLPDAARTMIIYTAKRNELDLLQVLSSLLAYDQAGGARELLEVRLVS